MGGAVDAPGNVSSIFFLSDVLPHLHTISALFLFLLFVREMCLSHH
jgi:hypothetical protein